MKKRGFLHVIVHSGQGLPPSDFAILAKPSSDPYCVLNLGHQSHRTPTVDKNLDPTWEYRCNFRLATAGANFVQWASGASGPRQSLAPHSLDITVYDEDTWSKDDLLGRASIDLRTALVEPNKWHKQELALAVAEGVKPGTHNLITVSVKWESAPPMSSYALRLLGFVFFAVSCATSFLAANCRWESAPTSEGAVKQPGVGAALVLASIVLLLALLIHLVLAHCHVGGLAELLEQIEMGPAPDGDEPENSEGAHIVKCFARPRKIAYYEISVHPTVDLSGLATPTLLVAWLLPIGGAALVSLAITLQVLQAGQVLPIKAGQVLAFAAILSVALGYRCILRAEADKRSRIELSPEDDKSPTVPSQKLLQHSNTASASIASEEDHTRRGHCSRRRASA